jgi:hypothetical protein
MQIRERGPEHEDAAKEREGATHILELQEAKLAEVGDGDARALGGDDELHIAHLLRPKVVHRRQPVKHPHPAPSLPPEPPSRSCRRFAGAGRTRARCGGVPLRSDDSLF